MNKITINGTTTKTNGNKISVLGKKIFCNESEIEVGELSGTVDIRFEGDLASLICDGNVEISGNVKGHVDASGNVECGDVGGNVDAYGGSVSCGQVCGNVRAYGSVKMNR